MVRRTRTEAVAVGVSHRRFSGDDDHRMREVGVLNGNDRIPRIRFHVAELLG
jgi:hypothetical protein